MAALISTARVLDIGACVAATAARSVSPSPSGRSSPADKKRRAEALIACPGAGIDKADLCGYSGSARVRSCTRQSPGPAMSHDPRLRILSDLEKKVLWLSSWMIHHAITCAS